MASRTESSVKKEIVEATTQFVHPKSRKSKAFIKKIKKESKKEKSKQETKLKQCLIADKLLWFQKHLDPNICPYTAELTAPLVEKYIQRNDEELEQINIKRSIGINRNQQHIGRENAIRITKDKETTDYESCGLEIPNILNSNQCNMLKKWNGDLKYLPNFKFCRFSKRHLQKEITKQKSDNKEKQKPLEINLIQKSTHTNVLLNDNSKIELNKEADNIMEVE